MNRTSDIDFRLISDSMPQMVFVSTPAGEANYFNRRWYEYTGSVSNADVDDSWIRFVHADDIDLISSSWANSVEKKTIWEQEYRVRRQDGVYRWHLGRAVPDIDAAGDIRRWVGTITDIQARKCGEEDLKKTKDSLETLAFDKTLELRQANSFLDSLVENIPNMIFVKDAKDLNFVRFNRAGEDLLGVSRADLIGRNDFDFFSPEEAKSFQEVDRKVLSEGRILDIPEETISSKTLGPRVLHTKKIPLNDEAGDPIYLLGISEDITEQKKLAEANLLRLREQIAAKESEKAQQRLLFLSKASALLGSSLSYETTLSNLTKLCVPAISDWCSIQTLNSEGVLTQIAVAHTNPEKVAWAWDLSAKYPAQKDSTTGPYRVVRDGVAELVTDVRDEMLQQAAVDDEHLDLLRDIGLRSYICAPIKARNQVLGVLILMTTAQSDRDFSTADASLAEDLGERAGYAVENAKLYKESSNLNRVKDEFLATLSHELRTPLNVIQGHAEILKAECMRLSHSQIAASIDAIYRNAKAQTDLISDLLDVSSIITGKVSYRPVSFNPSDMISHILESMSATAKAKGVRLVADLSRAPRRAVADPSRLQQVIWNLLSNALKFTPRDGSVRIDVDFSQDEWWLSVSDTGCGIDPGFLPYVFDRFRQEDASSTRPYTGLGLGLAIVRNLVEIHGGRVAVESKGKALGSTFKIFLPLVSLPTSEEQHSAPIETPPSHDCTRANLNGVKVLLVEDSKDNRELIRFYLTRAGAVVTEAESADKARERLQAFVPDVIVSDIGLPGENGIELMRKLRKSTRSQGIPAVALTAYVRESEKAEALAAGFQQHLCKPVSGPKLVNTLQSLLGLSAQH